MNAEVLDPKTSTRKEYQERLTELRERGQRYRPIWMQEPMPYRGEAAFISVLEYEYAVQPDLVEIDDSGPGGSILRLTAARASGERFTVALAALSKFQSEQAETWGWGPETDQGTRIMPAIELPRKWRRAAYEIGTPVSPVY